MSARLSPPPRVTHLVLVDGLPVDSWVVTGPDADAYADGDRGADGGRYADASAYADAYADSDARGWGRAGSRGSGGDVRGDRDRWDDPDDHRPRVGDDEARWPDPDLGWDPVTGLLTRPGHLRSLGPPAPPRPSQEELRLLDLEELVGGADALTALDAEPLPAERLDQQSVPPELRQVVHEVLDRCDEVVDRWFDEESRTVLHRLVGVVLADRPTLLADPDVARTAASLCWMVGRGNGFVGPIFGTHTVTNKALLEHFRQPSNVVEQLAARLLPKTSVVPVVGDGWGAGGQGWRRTRTRPRSGYLLGRPEWLVARWRVTLARERDELLRQLADRAAAAAAMMPAITAAITAGITASSTASSTAATVDPPPLETGANPDGAPEWERSLRLLNPR